MTVVLDRPYEFVPPHRGNLWPSFIQTFRLVDRYLKRKEGVVAHQCRHLERLKASLQRGDGVLLAPNHCRYADPLVMGWPARLAGTHVYAMASWHLFNEGSFDAFAIRKMGGFSVNREGSDRQSLETAIDILATAQRPLILFPEGTTNRTNDVLKPLLDGVAFIARSAARRRAKRSGGQVVVHPVGMKYLCVDDDVTGWIDQQLIRLEQQLGWCRPADQSLLQRTIRLAEALLALKEVQYFGQTRTGELPSRRDMLIGHLLDSTEQQLGLDSNETDIRARVRTIRTEVVKQHFDNGAVAAQIDRLKNLVAAADLAQELLSYPDCYLMADQVTDTRMVETIQRMQETLFGKADSSVELRVVIEIGEPMVVPTDKTPRGQTDPLMLQLHERLSKMLERLSAEARPFSS
ncbi:MAG: 1-acyl-sn-glycerol-3-phosphate acyltransferase [Pirellulales bacterium]|nr:1-acyl-sn-glycerol-3-phosphate acyltransferase [Pirellulales bacterium]